MDSSSDEEDADDEAVLALEAAFDGDADVVAQRLLELLGPFGAERGTRRVTHVSEILGMENDIVTLQDVYRFDFAAGVDHSGRFLGKAQPTGIRPRFLTRFDELGVPFDASLFTTAADRADWA